VRNQFAQRAGFTLLPEQIVVDLYGTPYPTNAWRRVYAPVMWCIKSFAAKPAVGGGQDLF